MRTELRGLIRSEVIKGGANGTEEAYLSGIGLYMIAYRTERRYLGNSEHFSPHLLAITLRISVRKTHLPILLE